MLVRYLKTEPEPRAEKILVSDIRDVVFFGDPFSDFESGMIWNTASSQVFFVMEKQGVNMAYTNNPINSNWLTACYPDGKKYDTEQVSCSGTVFGTATGIREYVARMRQEIATHPDCESTLFCLCLIDSHMPVPDRFLAAENVLRQQTELTKVFIIISFTLDYLMRQQRGCLMRPDLSPPWGFGMKLTLPRLYQTVRAD